MIITQEGGGASGDQTSNDASIDPVLIQKYRASSSSVPEMMRSVPGMSMQTGGGMSVIPVLRGFNDAGCSNQ